MEGWIRLHRDILDSDVFASQKMLKIWVWCLCKANFKDRTVPLKVGRGETLVKVKRGQFIFGRFKAEEDLFIDGSTIYKIMQRLEKMNNIKIQSNNQYSIVTINNYNDYQKIETKEITTNEQPSSKQVTTNEQPSNTTKKDKKDKNEYKLIPKDLQMVIAYMTEKNCMSANVEGQKFYDHFNSNGWKVGGKASMKDWRSAVNTWLGRIGIGKKAESEITFG